MSTTSSPLSWGHQALNEVFRKLPDFSAVLIEAGSKENFAVLRSLLEKDVSQSAERAALKPQLIMGPNEAEISNDADIVILVHPNLSEEDRKTLTTIDSALICLIESSDRSAGPQVVVEPFDLHIRFTTDKAHCLIKGEAAPIVFDCALQIKSKPVIEEKSEDRYVLEHGFTSTELNYFKSVMPQVGFVSATSKDAPQGIHVATVIAGPYPDPKVEAALSKAAKDKSVLFVPKRELRTEDRIRLFRSGVVSLLSANAEREEVLAALTTLMSEARDSATHQVLHPDDLAFAEMQRFMRKNLYFELGQEDVFIRTFQAPVANRISRAKSGGQVCSALVLRLGRHVFENIRHRMTVLVSGIVRQNDVVFSCGQAIVVVSSNLNKITARAILKRLKLSADPEWLRACQTSLIPVKDVESKSGTEADQSEAFLQSVFAACRPS